MEIYVNDHKLDVNLENERTMGDVFQGVSKWVETNGKYIVSCFADGRDFGIQEMGGLDYANFRRMDFIIGEELDVLVSGLEELDRYVDNIGNTLVGRDSLTEGEARDLAEGMIWIDSIITSAKKLLKLRLDTIRPMGKGKNVEEILDSLHARVTHLETVESLESFLEDLRDLKLFILDLRNRTAILDLDKEKLLEIVKEYSENMAAIQRDFISVNEHFQAGRDPKATEILTHSINRLNTLLTALISLKNTHPDLKIESIRVGEEELSQFNQNLNEVLLQIVTALENQDIVSAGDILEYELPDYLERFQPFLNQIIEKIEVFS